MVFIFKARSRPNVEVSDEHWKQGERICKGRAKCSFARPHGWELLASSSRSQIVLWRWLSAVGPRLSTLDQCLASALRLVTVYQTTLPLSPHLSTARSPGDRMLPTSQRRHGATEVNSMKRGRDRTVA